MHSESDKKMEYQLGDTIQVRVPRRFEVKPFEQFVHEFMADDPKVSIVDDVVVMTLETEEQVEWANRELAS